MVYLPYIFINKLQYKMYTLLFNYNIYIWIMIHGLFYKMPLRETLFYTVTGSYERPLSMLSPFRIYGCGQSVGGQWMPGVIVHRAGTAIWRKRDEFKPRLGICNSETSCFSMSVVGGLVWGYCATAPFSHRSFLPWIFLPPPWTITSGRRTAPISCPHPFMCNG